MKPLLIPMFICAVCVSHAGAADAQTDRDVRIESGEAKKLAVPAGKLMRVDEGLFTIKFGQTIDLTNRKILLTLKYDSNNECCILVINGQRMQVRGSSWAQSSARDWVGQRFNLKQINSTKSDVIDKEACFIDIVDAVDRKGAPGTATFRLFCE
jgi:hypothetical protein